MLCTPLTGAFAANSVYSTTTAANPWRIDHVSGGQPSTYSVPLADPTLFGTATGIKNFSTLNSSTSITSQPLYRSLFAYCGGYLNPTTTTLTPVPQAISCTDISTGYRGTVTRAGASHSERAKN